MSITGSLYSGVSGLKAQSTAIGTISDNISNANTTGYKGTNAQFETLVTNALGRTSYTPGGVLPRPIQGIDRQGLLQASSSSTDVGIAGRGFFLVSNQLSSTGTISSSAPRAFTRAGSFQIDKQGNMVNTAGYYLLGVPTDTKGNPVTSNPALSAVTPVNVGTLTGLASPTKTLSIGANLPAVPGVPSSLKLNGVLDGLATVNDANRYVVSNSKGANYEIRLQYQKSGTAAQPAYDVRVISLLPIGNAPAIDITKTPIPASLGTVVLGASGSSISGGTGVSFVDGSTFTPAINVNNLIYGTTGNVVSRAGVDSQDVTSVVYDSLGVASNLTLQLDRASDLNRNLPSGVTNSLTLKGKLTDAGTGNYAATAGTATIAGNAAYFLDPNTYTLLNSNGDAYSATISYANTGFDSTTTGTSTWALRIDSLTPIGDAAALSPVPGFPVVLGTLAVGQTGSTFTIAAPAPSLNFAAVNNTINPSANRPAGTMPFTAATLPASQLTGLTLSRSGSNTLTVGGTLDTAAAIGTFTPATTAPITVTMYSSVGYAYTASFVLQKTQEGSNSPDVWDFKLINLVPVTAPTLGAGGPAASPVPSVTNPITVGSFQAFPSPTGAIYTSTGASVSFGSTSAGSLSVPASAVASTNLFIGAVAAAPTITNVAAAAGITNVASSGPGSIGVVNTGTVAGPTQNQWLTSISSMTLVATGAPSIIFPLAATGAQRLPIYLDGNANDAAKTPTSATLAASLIKFNTNGTIAAGAPTRIPTLPMGTGAADFGGSNFTLNLGAANTAGGLTQFTNQFAVSFLSQDGVPFGFRTGVTIDSEGLVKAVFDNGTSVPLYKIPLVNFASVNELTAISGNVFQVSNGSGDAVANYAGIGGTGKISPATLEASTVDLSQEFSNLIIAQRSYSANAKTITTADELLQEVIALKR